MPQVFYANRKIKDACENDPAVMDKINRLIHNQLSHGDDVEKLHTKFPVYRIKINKKGRIIYTYQDSLRDENGDLIPIILELDEDHKYDSKYLESGVYRSFFENNSDEFILAVESEQKPKSDPTASIQAQIVHIIGKETIFFDEQQEAISIPAIIEGPPGSGKTSVAFASLEKFAINNQDPEKKLLYVTQSQRLAAHVRDLWRESPYYQPGHQEGVYILSYGELLAKFYPGLDFAGSAKEEVIQFLLRSEGMIGKNLKTAQRQEKAELLYLEFRILSGMSADDYLHASNNISHFPKDQRQQVVQAFKLWTASHKAIYPEFHEIDPIGKEFDIVITDETQDFSHLETKNLMNLAKNKQCVFCIDPKQNLKDNQSKIVYLQNEFFKQPHSLKVEPVQLQGTYRCPPEIMTLAKEIDILRLQLIPQGKQGAAINLTNHKKGNVTWLDPESQAAEKTLSDFKYTRDCFIVTDETNKNQLLSEGFSRVFTAEEIKGLQANTVVLYKPLDSDIFRKINASLERLNDGASISAEENLSFGPALCSFFTSSTRAQEHLIIMQKNSEHLKQIIKPLKNKAQTATPSVATAVINQTESLKQAKELFDKDHITQAMAILTHEVFTHDEKKSEKVQEQIKLWSKSEPPKPIKSKTKPEKVVNHFQQVEGMLAISNFMASTDKDHHLVHVKQALESPEIQLIVKGNQQYNDRVIDKLISITLNPNCLIADFRLVVEILLEFDDTQLETLDSAIKIKTQNDFLQPALYKILKDFAESGNKKAAHFMAVHICRSSVLFDDPKKKVPYLQKGQEYHKIAGSYKLELRKNLKIDELLAKAQTQLNSMLTPAEIKKFEQYFQMIQNKTITDAQIKELEEFTETYAFHNFYLKKSELSNKFIALLTSRFVHDYARNLNPLSNFTLSFFQKHDPYELFQYAKLLKLEEKAYNTQFDQMIFHMVSKAASGDVEEAKIWMMNSLQSLDIHFYDFEFVAHYCADCTLYAKELSKPGHDYVNQVAKSIQKINECGEFKNDLHEIKQLFHTNKLGYEKLLHETQIQAIRVGHLFMVKQLIMASTTYSNSTVFKINWNLQDPESQETLLHKLCSKREPNYLISLRFLATDRNVDVTIKDKRGLSPFAISALLKEPQAINIMLANKEQLIEKLIHDIPEKFSQHIYQFFLLDSLNQTLSSSILEKARQVIADEIKMGISKIEAALKN